MCRLDKTSSVELPYDIFQLTDFANNQIIDSMCLFNQIPVTRVQSSIDQNSSSHLFCWKMLTCIEASVHCSFGSRVCACRFLFGSSMNESHANVQNKYITMHFRCGSADQISHEECFTCPRKNVTCRPMCLDLTWSSTPSHSVPLQLFRKHETASCRDVVSSSFSSTVALENYSPCHCIVRQVNGRCRSTICKSLTYLLRSLNHYRLVNAWFLWLWFHK